MGEIADEHVDRMLDEGYGYPSPRHYAPRPRPGFTVTADDFDVVPDDEAKPDTSRPDTLPALIEEISQQLDEAPEPESDEAVLFALLEEALPYLKRLSVIDVEDLV